ncbi:VAC1 protein [Ceratocystis lukuohia]
MSGRKLGGGRILGNGRALGPPLPPSPSPAASLAATSPSPSISNGGGVAIRRSAASAAALAGFDAMSESSFSASSPTPSALLADNSHDLLANISVVASHSHIDDEHQELPAVAQDEVRTWFDKQVSKAKRFQPLSLINQKLRGLDVFESNESAPPSTAGPVIKFPETTAEPDEMISRSHWQRQTSNDYCTDPTCEQRLGPLNAPVNCRKCGRLFCEAHTMYQMKLSRSAVHEPVRGVWARVCETCYKSREGYNDHHGALIDHTDLFVSIRTKRTERQNLDVTRLEKRLTKLTRLLAAPPEEQQPAAFVGSAGILTQKNQRKNLEQSIVTWEDDAAVARCPFCQQEFGSWTFRRHHCRMCGKVVCADAQTSCSSEIGLNVESPLEASEKPGQANIPVDIRMCRDCIHTLFSKRDFIASIAHQPPDQRAYDTLKQFERGIRQLIPRFQKSLVALQTDNPSSLQVATLPSHAQIKEAGKIRRRLIDSFTKYDAAARRLRDLRTESATQLRLQKAIYAAASAFLHTHMLTLKSVPNILRHSSSKSQPGTPSSKNHLSHPHHHHHRGRSNSGLSPLRHAEASETASQASETSTAMSMLEIEERQVREKLIVLEEQRFMVQQMIDSAHGGRRFEEVSALTRNVEELDAEIAHAKARVGNVEERWHGLYAMGEA